MRRQQWLCTRAKVHVMSKILKDTERYVCWYSNDSKTFCIFTFRSEGINRCVLEGAQSAHLFRGNSQMFWPFIPSFSTLDNRCCDEDLHSLFNASLLKGTSWGGNWQLQCTDMHALSFCSSVSAAKIVPSSLCLVRKVMWTALGQHFSVCSKGDGVALALSPVLSKCLGIYVPDRVFQTAFHKELTSLMTCKPTPTPTAMNVQLSIEQISVWPDHAGRLVSVIDIRGQIMMFEHFCAVLWLHDCTYTDAGSDASINEHTGTGAAMFNAQGCQRRSGYSSRRHATMQ